jgi:hypothetical protein
VRFGDFNLLKVALSENSSKFALFVEFGAEAPESFALAHTAGRVSNRK